MLCCWLQYIKNISIALTKEWLLTIYPFLIKVTMCNRSDIHLINSNVKDISIWYPKLLENLKT